MTTGTLLPARLPLFCLLVASPVLLLQLFAKKDETGLFALAGRFRVSYHMSLSYI